MPPPEKGFLDNRMEPWVEGVVYIRARPLTAELDAGSRHFSSSKHIYDRACCVLLIFSVRIKHVSSSKHSYDLACCVLLIFSVRLSRVQSCTHRVPPRVLGEGLLDRGAGSSQSAVGGAS